MISPALLALVRCPECASPIRCDGGTCRCTRCDRTFDAAAGYLDLRPRQAFDEQTKYLDEALHVDARHESVAPPLLGSRIRQDMLRSFLKLRPGDRVLDLGCGSGRTLVWNADSGAALTGVDISAHFAAAARDRVDLVLGDLRRLPFVDGAFTKAWSLDVLEHLSPQALGDVLREARRVLAPGGALFVYSHVRQNGWIAGGVRLVNRFARFCERLGLLDLTQERLRKSDHLNPLADHDHLRRVAAAAGFEVERLTYYTPIVGAFVENVLVRAAERALTRRAARTSGDSAAAARQVRAAAQARVSRRGAAYRALVALTYLMKLDVFAFGRVRSGPFFVVLRGTGEFSTDREESAVRHGSDLRSDPCRTAVEPRSVENSPVPLVILYAALDQTVPGVLGGAVHVQAVAEGLAALGHQVHVATTRGADPWPDDDVHWHDVPPPFGRHELRWLRTGAIADLARRVGADVIIERYYNFGGEGILAARRLGIPGVLEVNAPVVDYPGSPKAAVDRALLVEPMRRWRDRICRLTDLFVTPSAQILPPWVDRRRVLQLEWGADTDKFRPDPGGPPPYPRDPNRILCVFAGAFRSWHGVVQLAAALARLHASGDRRFGAVFIGDGPERHAAQRAARDVPGVIFTGALPHSQLPFALAAADIGVAPFDPAKHRPLRLGFYWSPLKIFEYMAVGLPVVAPDLPRLHELIEPGVEGLLYPGRDPRALDQALVALADPGVRRTMGRAARTRVVRDFSWQGHCAALSARLRTLVAR